MSCGETMRPMRGLVVWTCLVHFERVGRYPGIGGTYIEALPTSS